MDMLTPNTAPHLSDNVKPHAAITPRGAITTDEGLSVPSHLPSEQSVKEIIASVYMRSPRDVALTWQDIDSDRSLYNVSDVEDSLGLDSLDAVEIATELEETFDVVLPTEINPTEVLTVNQVVKLLGRLLDEQRES